MDYSTLLLEFMDGTLEGTNELALFNALSSNEELRAEFKHLLAISSSVRNDITPFLPPISSTQHIFTQLGFTPPLPVLEAAVGTAAGVMAASAGKSVLSNISRFFPAMASAVLASLTTAAIFISLGGQQQEPLPPGSIAHAPRTPSLDRIVAHNLGAGNAQLPQAAAQQTPVHEVVRYVYIPQPVAQQSQSEETAVPVATTEPEHTEYQTPEAIRHAMALSAQLGSSELPKPDARLTSTKPVAILSAGNWWESSPAALTVELRDNVSLSFPSATVEPTTTSWWNNKSLSLLYALSDRQSVGVELGQEAFFQRFEARNAAGRRYQYEQSPVLQWAGVAYRFSISEIGAFNPFGQVVLGGTRVGYLGKTMVGVNYTPTPSLRLTAGIEGSLLYYPVQGSLYRSGKLGFSYGIGFTF